MAFLSCAFIIRDGEEATKFVYMVGWGFALFSGVYFAIDSLPSILAYISHILPFAYIFDALRAYILDEQILWNAIIIGFTLNLLYLGSTLLLFYKMFERSRNRGLSSLIG